MDERYEIIEQIGEGGTALTFLVWDHKLEKEWVMKRIPVRSKEQSEAVKRETQALLRIKTEGIPTLTDIIHSEKEVCLIMEYIKGESLKDYIDRRGALSEKEARKTALEIAKIVDFLHSQAPPIIHGDLKPSNIIKKEEGVALLDFGASVIFRDSSDEASGFYTPGYASPELMAGDAAGILSDVYAMGAVMFYMVTGKEPLDMRLIPNVREWDPIISRELAYLIEDCTAHVMDKRCRSMKEVADRLKKSWTVPDNRRLSEDLFRPLQSIIATEGKV